MYTQSFIFSAVAVLLAAQVHAAPIRARQAPGSTNNLPINTPVNVPMGLPLNLPVTTVTNTNTSGGGGSAGSSGSDATPPPPADPSTRQKGSKVAKRGSEAAAIVGQSNAGLAQLNEIVGSTIGGQGASTVTGGIASAAGHNHEQVTQPAATGAPQGDDGAGEDDGTGEDGFTDVTEDDFF